MEFPISFHNLIHFHIVILVSNLINSIRDPSSLHLFVSNWYFEYPFMFMNFIYYSNDQIQWITYDLTPFSPNTSHNQVHTRFYHIWWNWAFKLKLSLSISSRSLNTYQIWHINTKTQFYVSRVHEGFSPNSSNLLMKRLDWG